ncbi:MAG: phenylacetate--CoA ligase family protein [Anaerolineae bacterium]
MSSESIGKQAIADSQQYPHGYPASLAEAVEIALQHTPAYASWAPYWRQGSQASLFRRMAQLPILTKRELRKFGPGGFVPAGRNLEAALANREVELVQTSGTTSDQVSNVWFQEWWNRCEAASWQLNRFAREAATGKHREAILTSPLCSGVPCEEALLLPPEERRIGRFLFLSEKTDPRTWDDDLMARMVTEINAYQPVLLEANPSFLAILARYILRTGAAVYRPQLITFTYENPSLLHYRLVRQAFDAPVASSYGATEAGYVFMECEYGRLHQICANVHIDFLPFMVEQGGPSVGQVVVTTLTNPWRALLRFDLGDLVRLAAEPCPCGVHDGLTLESTEGRTINLTYTPAGRGVTLGMVDRTLARLTGLVEYQVLQTGPADYTLYLVVENAPAETVSAKARSMLQELYGPGARVVTELVPAIAPDPPGKYRLVKNILASEVAPLLDPEFAPPSLEG